MLFQRTFHALAAAVADVRRPGMTDTCIRFILPADLAAIAASAAEPEFPGGFAGVTKIRLLTSEPIFAVVIIDIRLGTAFCHRMSADFSGYGSS